jgi:acetylornithine deacetylase/succinyl-diaminopimelate desuccinylase-like protein
MPSWTDAGNLLVHHGIAAVVFGAGDLASAHSDNESIRVEDLARLSTVLARLLRTYG